MAVDEFPTPGGCSIVSSSLLACGAIASSSRMVNAACGLDSGSGMLLWLPVTSEGAVDAGSDSGWLGGRVESRLGMLPLTETTGGRAGTEGDAGDWNICVG